jgi:hypothetical protein
MDKTYTDLDTRLFTGSPGPRSNPLTLVVLFVWLTRFLMNVNSTSPIGDLRLSVAGCRMGIHASRV